MASEKTFAKKNHFFLHLSYKIGQVRSKREEKNVKRLGNGEIGRWRDMEMERQGDREIGRWRDREMER